MSFELSVTNSGTGRDTHSDNLLLKACFHKWHSFRKDVIDLWLYVVWNGSEISMALLCNAFHMSVGLLIRGVPVEAVPGLVLLGRKMSCILQSFSPWLIPQTKRMRTKRLLWMTFWVLKVLSKPLATPCRPQTCISPMKHFSWVLDTAKKCVWLWALIWHVLSLYWYSVVCFY